MRDNYMKGKGFKYYVYVHSGFIVFFVNYKEAKEFADSIKKEVKELD